MADTNRDLNSYWGWGVAEKLPGEAERGLLVQQAAALLGCEAPPGFARAGSAEPVLPEARVGVPGALTSWADDATGVRRSHSYGKGFLDQVAGLVGHYPSPPDFVLFPRHEDEIAASLRVCAEHKIAVVPFGGGTSVVGGVETRRERGFAGVATLSLRRMNRVLEVDKTMRAARIEAGATGPEIEAALAGHGLTLRHYPQSFEFSTLGGWLATHAGGHFATVYTHIDDLVQAIRVVTPRGIVATRQVPASGAGPKAEPLFLGSEGVLGVFSEAWLRLQARPHLRSSASVQFSTLEAAVEATRAVAQSGLFPSNCRLLDEGEALLAGAGMQPTLLLGFESAERPVRERLELALGLALARGGRCDAGPIHREGQRGGDDSTEKWRSQFLAAPYRQSALLAGGFLADTFETACTWTAFPALLERVRSVVGEALVRACGVGTLMMRFTHVYPDGPAPYFTFVAPLPAAADQVQRMHTAKAIWWSVKQAAMQAICASGGTITHHHAVGRTHQPGYLAEQPSLFLAALRAAKASLDPQQVCNPGVLWPSEPASEAASQGRLGDRIDT